MPASVHCADTPPQCIAGFLGPLNVLLGSSLGGLPPLRQTVRR